MEFEGRTVKEAIQKALQELKVKRSQLKIEVVSEEKMGLFGMPGAKPAKIKVRMIKDKENT